jgi:hypothetical protein
MKYSRWAEGEKISLGRRRAKPVLIRMRIFHSARITRIAYNNLVVILKNVIERHLLFNCYSTQIIFKFYARVICLALRGLENLGGFSPNPFVIPGLFA